MTDALPPPSPVPAPAPAVAPPLRQTSGMAITSLVLGILGWTMLPLLGSIVAVICGHIARAEIRRDAATTEGDGLAIAGLVLGWSMIVISLLSLLAIVLFFGGLAVLLGALGASGQL